MAEKENSKKLFSNVYFKALVLTAIIFVLGLSLGWYFDWTRSNAVRGELEDLKIQADEARVAMVFFETFKSDPQFCGVYATEMNAQLQRIGALGLKLESLREANKLDESYYALKQQYVLFNTELWLRSENLKKLCSSTVTTILYFYPENKECESCVAQANELLQLKRSCPESVWLFALPTDLNVTVVDMLVQRFGVVQTPSLVVDGQTFGGMHAATELRERFPALSSC